MGLQIIEICCYWHFTIYPYFAGIWVVIYFHSIHVHILFPGDPPEKLCAFLWRSHTSKPRLKLFWMSGIRNLIEASAWGKRRCFFTRSRTSSGLTRSPTLCWAINLTKTHTERIITGKHLRLINCPFIFCYHSLCITIVFNVVWCTGELFIGKNLFSLQTEI